MHIAFSSTLALFAYSASVSAAPAKGCSPVDAVYLLLKGSLQAQASSLCVSFLGGDKTVLQTRTQIATGAPRTTIVSAPDQTQVTNVEVTNVNQVRSTELVYQPDPTITQYVTVAGPVQTVYQRRGNNVVLPPKLASFASSRISSACSCIATPTTRTILATQTSTIAGAQATVSVPGNTVVVTVTRTLQVTSVDYATSTLAATGVVVQTATVTAPSILVKPKICNARGLPGPNAFNYDANFNTNQAACIASCKTDNRCLATGFYIVTDPSTGTQTGTCRKYDKSVTDSADLGPGYYNFNDKAC